MRLLEKHANKLALSEMLGRKIQVFFYCFNGVYVSLTGTLVRDNELYAINTNDGSISFYEKNILEIVSAKLIHLGENEYMKQYQ